MQSLLTRPSATPSALAWLFAGCIATLAMGCSDDKKTGGDASDTTGTNSCTKDQECVGKITAAPCREAVCNTTTRQCEAAPVADGGTCSTGNACLVGESCTAGTCAGGTKKPAECGARECGNDACGNTCGSCTGTEECTTAGQCESDPTACGNITFEGCCTATGVLKYCVDDVLDTVNCAANNERNACGWLDSSGGFDCAEQGEPSPDAETYPYLCDGETAPANACQGRVCGYHFGVSCGGACGSGLACNADGQCADPCTDKACGDFGGKHCGDCTGGDVCYVDGQCGPDVCGTLTFEGCCDGDVTFWCENNEVVTQDCQAEFEVGCGWVPFDEAEGDGDYYFCGGEGSDPSETLAAACSAYTFVKPGETPVEPSPEVAPEESPEPAAEESPEPQPEENPEVDDDTTQAE